MQIRLVVFTLTLQEREASERALRCHEKQRERETREEESRAWDVILATRLMN